MATLLVMRHAHAVSAAQLRCDDEDRPLSPAGATAAKCLGQLLRAVLSAPPSVLVSPLRRTLETARGVAAGWSSVQLETVLSLAPGSGDLFTYDLGAEQRTGNVICIGHIPDVIRITEAFTSIALPPSVFEPASLVWIEFSAAILRGRGAIANIISATLAERIVGKPAAG